MSSESVLPEKAAEPVVDAAEPAAVEPATEVAEPVVVAAVEPIVEVVEVAEPASEPAINVAAAVEVPKVYIRRW